MKNNWEYWLFWVSAQGKYKALKPYKSCMLEFFNWLQVIYGFYRKEGRSDRTLIEWGRDNTVLMAISLPFFLVEKSVVKVRPSEVAIQGRYQN